MAVDLTGTTEGLFRRLGKLGKEFLRIVDVYGSTLNTNIEAIRDLFETGNDAQVIDNIYASRDSYKNVHSSYQQILKTYCQNLVIEQVHRDTPLLNKTLTEAMKELIRQMKSSSSDVLRPTIAATATNASANSGDGVFVTSLTGPYGDPLDFVYDESIKFTCTGDTSTGVTKYRETYSYVGEPSVAYTDKDWPVGSGCSGSMTLFDAGGQNDLITNGGFDTWTNASAAPDSWTIVTGTAGTTIERASAASDVKRGAYSCRFDSDGSTLLAIKQQLSTTLVKPNKVYLLNLWAKVDTLDATGVVRFRLADGNGTTLTNDAGTSQSYTRNVNGNIGTSYTQVSTSFQTPKQLPSTGVFLYIEFTTAPANGRMVYFDLVGLLEGTQLYNGGCYTRGFSAATNNAITDYTTIAVTNNAPNAGWVRIGQRLLDMPTLGPTVYWPSVTAIEEISNSLLV